MSIVEGSPPQVTTPFLPHAMTQPQCGVWLHRHTSSHGPVKFNSRSTFGLNPNVGAIKEYLFLVELPQKLPDASARQRSQCAPARFDRQVHQKWWALGLCRKCTHSEASIFFGAAIRVESLVFYVLPSSVYSVSSATRKTLLQLGGLGCSYPLNILVSRVLLHLCSLHSVPVDGAHYTDYARVRSMGL